VGRGGLETDSEGSLSPNVCRGVELATDFNSRFGRTETTEHATVVRPNKAHYSAS